MREGLAYESECTDCPAGRYCGSTGLPTWSGDCDAGYFCIGKAKIAAPVDNITGIICPIGKQFFKLSSLIN